MNAIQIYQYQDSPIEFEMIGDSIMANATTMCRAFGKKPDDIFKTKQWVEFEQAVCEDLKLCFEDLRITRKGNSSGFEQGTWIHQELVLELARRLNPRFAVWCNRKMAELLRTGQVAIKEISRKELAKMIWEAEEAKEKLALENQHLKALRDADQPKVEFYEAVTGSSDVTDLGTVAKLLNIPGLGRTKLFAQLREKRILMKNNRPYQAYVDRGWFRVVESKWTNPNGTQHVYFKTVVFQKGVAGIRELLLSTNKQLHPGISGPIVSHSIIHDQSL